MTGRHVWISHIRGVSSLRTTRPVIALGSRCFSTTCPRTQAAPPSEENKNDEDPNSEKQENETPMARRLAQMTEDAMLEGGRSGRRNMEQAGFSNELKKELEERIAASSFKSEHASAHSLVDMPVRHLASFLLLITDLYHCHAQSSAGQGTRDTAASTAWTGTENLQDSVLRMLDDASTKIPQPVNLKPAPKPKRSPGRRLAEAKERTSTYTLSQSPGFSEDEREKMRQEMKDKLTPGAHSMPISIQGLQSLANERIEDAISRGQFRKIRRGKGINTERDHNANNAFIDTTEYFMNKIIQKQEIVPPWIEKQQELAGEVNRFRQRIRAEWRRHAARLISSQGGSVEAQMKRAHAYAAAEARLAERAKLEVPLRDTDTTKDGKAVIINTDAQNQSVSTPSKSTEPTATHSANQASSEDIPHLPPLRDQGYLAIERSYHDLAVEHLNKLTRSYNLQAPPSAHKPYINLERELNSCYADVAPGLAEEIRRRATERARGPTSATGPAASAVFESLGRAQNVRVYEEDTSKGYGFKELWRDLFSK